MTILISLSAKVLACALIFLSSSPYLRANAMLIKDYGIIGTTFAIQEEDISQVILKRLKVLDENGSLEQYQYKLAQQAQKRIKRPAPCKSIVHTKIPCKYLYDPSISAPYDLKDDQGRIFYKQGTKINPLSIKSLSKTLLFIDGDDQKQVNWAYDQGDDAHVQIILVKGSPFELMERSDRRIYFDQGGAITSKLGIEQVPARLSQQDQYLLIEEVLLEERIDK